MPSPAYEYVKPVTTAYRRKHGAPPPINSRDPRWCRHVATTVTAYLRRLRRHLAASGRKVELAVGIPAIAPLSDEPLLSRAADWQRWIDEGLIDTLVINFVKWDRERPLESTRSLYRDVLRVAAGRCRVLCPVQQYDYSRHGLPAYEKATGKPNAELARDLTRIAWEEGAHGISLECVDHNNYRPATRAALRALTAGPCRHVRPRTVGR